MSFRTRLILCFSLIVLVPVAVVALGLTRIADEWRTTRTDAGLTTGAQTALSVFGDKLAAAADDARAAGRDEALGASLRSGDAGAAQRAVGRLARELDLAALSVRGPSGHTLASVGEAGAPGAAEVAVRGPGGLLGQVRATALRPDRYVAQVSALTGDDVALVQGRRIIAATAELSVADLPNGEDTADVELPAGESRALTAVPRGAGPGVRVAVLGPRSSSGLDTSRPLLIAGGVGLFALAVLFILLLVRTLQGQVREMLTAARRIGGGDFTRRVPVEGDDELAGLAREFNTMSERLGEQMAELRSQGAELERSVRRIGEAFAAGLDRKAVLEVAADAALAACDAESARVLLTGAVSMKAEAGQSLAGDLGGAIREAEERALSGGVAAESARGAAFALAQPLPGAGAARARRGLMTIARTGAPFDGAQREMLRYLAGQAAVPLENIELSELVSEGAITDAVTGLPDSRRLRELLADEVERAERYGHELALVVLGVDHPAGISERNASSRADEVLRDVARIVDDASRGVGKPGRWGAGELAVVMPETGVDGALELAERIRTAIEQARIPLSERPGTQRVTASLGIAALARFGGTADGLIAAAGAALDRARARGGNRTEATARAARAAPP
ncbi:MAG TPA: diguanylate cyclase [Solirubrobacterales bacterium]|nr:diguanylate cyclase [Solirubrobacterales bacterium]